jgi:hypothetical protein
MKIPVNLRSDLAQLSDIELATRFENSWRAYEAADNRWGRMRWLTFPSFRGPIKHPRVYRFLSILGNGSGTLFDLLFAAALSDKRAERWLRAADPNTDAHLDLCEIRDVMDEMKRRVESRKQGNNGPAGNDNAARS